MVGTLIIIIGRNFDFQGWVHERTEFGKRGFNAANPRSSRDVGLGDPVQGVVALREDVSYLVGFLDEIVVGIVAELNRRDRVANLSRWGDGRTLAAHFHRRAIQVVISRAGGESLVVETRRDEVIQVVDGQAGDQSVAAALRWIGSRSERAIAKAVASQNALGAETAVEAVVSVPGDVAVSVDSVDRGGRVGERVNFHLLIKEIAREWPN